MSLDPRLPPLQTQPKRPRHGLAFNVCLALIIVVLIGLAVLTSATAHDGEHWQPFIGACTKDGVCTYGLDGDLGLFESEAQCLAAVTGQWEMIATSVLVDESVETVEVGCYEVEVKQG